jgi:hypothetical protein
MQNAYKLIIDSNYKDYHPLVNISMIDIFETNLKKYKQLFVFVDDLTIFYRTYRLFTDNCVFVLDKNIIIKKNDIEIEYVKYGLDETYNFKNKVLKHDFIRKYLC